MYQYGLAVAEDEQQAIRWYELAANQDSLEAIRRLIALYRLRGDKDSLQQVIRWSERAVKIGDTQTQNDYAWLLATSEFADIRNGTLALKHAQAVVAREKRPAYIDTLAAAYAEIGDFMTAIATQEDALESLDDADQGLRREFQQHLDTYQRQEPWRE